MFDIGNHKKVFDELCLALRRANEDKPRTRRMSYKAVPYDNALTYKGVALAEIMVPQVTESLVECQAAFDMLVENCTSTEYQPMDGVSDVLSPHFIEWLEKWNDPMDKAVMLLWAAGIAHGASVDYDDCSIIVTSPDMRFGISNRQIMSRFNSGLKFHIKSPEKLLKAEPMVRTFSAKTITLYREAYRNSEAAVDALLAIFTAYPNLDLWKYATKMRIDSRATPRDLSRWEKMLFKHSDPVHALYLVLCPVWLSRQQFRGIFGPMKDRNTNPGPLARQTMITKMYQYFYKNKETT